MALRLSSSSTTILLAGAAWYERLLDLRLRDLDHRLWRGHCQRWHADGRQLHHRRQHGRQRRLGRGAGRHRRHGHPGQYDRRAEHQGTGSGATPDDISGTVSSTSAYNLIGTGGSGGLVNGDNGNQVGVANPGLDPLANNGGPTQTIALLPGSPAIDAGSNALAVDPTTGQPLTTDQRGPDSHGSSTARWTSALSKFKSATSRRWTLEPANQTVPAGATASFTATAIGNPAPTVQWQSSTNGGDTFGDISGTAADTYSFTAVAGQNGDEYRAVFTNSFGSATSTAATLTVNTAPVVTTSPSDQTVTAGNTATFTATASGQPAPTVQWEVSSDGGQTYSDISGATADTYSFTAAAGQNGDQYVAVFTNSVGSVTSTAATLTVNTAPVVTTNPSSQTVAAGNTATFTATASGQPAPTVQWEVSSDGGQTFPTSPVPPTTPTRSRPPPAKMAISTSPSSPIVWGRRPPARPP